MAKFNEFFEKVAGGTGLRYDPNNKTLFGMRFGFYLVVNQVQSGSYQLKVMISMAKNGLMPNLAELRSIVKQDKAHFYSVNATGLNVTFTLKSANTWKKAADKATEAINQLPQILSNMGYGTVCSACGQPKEVDGYVIGGAMVSLCPDCFMRKSTDLNYEAQRQDAKPENIPAGIVGAFLGAILGGAAIFAILRLGRVSFILGILMGFCIVTGYSKLAGKMSKIGVTVSIIFAVITTFLVNHFDWALDVAKTERLRMTFWDAVRYIPNLMRVGVIEQKTYLLTFGQIALYNLIGAIIAIASAYSSDKKKFTTGRLTDGR